MLTLTIDSEKCTHCGLCCKMCISGILEMKDKDSAPTTVRDNEKYCLHCGHCQAFCPSGALLFDYEDSEKKSYEPVETTITPEQLGHYIRMRRSIRHYKKERVDKAVIENIMDVVRYAPTGKNTQCISWLVIHNPEEVKRLASMVIDWMRHMTEQKSPMAEQFMFPRLVEAWNSGYDIICHGAPHLFIACAPEANPIAPVDGLIALSYLDITLPAFGLGSCWAGFFDVATKYWKPLRDALQLPPGHVPIGTLMAGYPAHRSRHVPPRSRAKITWRE